MHRHFALRLAITALIALPLAACHDRTSTVDGTTASADSDAPSQSLPRPQSDGQPITGMPGARPQPARTDPATSATAPSASATPPASGNDTSTQSSPAPEARTDNDAQGAVIGDIPEPTIDDAMQVVREYYDAINRGAYGRAYALWGDRGAASGKTLQQFSDGFADTARDSVDIQRPTTDEGAAGSRYLEIPVRVIATQRDQSSRTYTGSYVLRRSMVDGASAEQRKWRIQSARLVPGN
ncbi:hypothetical protein [Solilutibacter silvestris]|uniref:Lipoprotein n=1 Tax=Solilutibacter silvestris TaxID=1645665 RepID=A0A2K1Q2Z7_9GAMM|nr:hypothetical protein [Lysobacter silvestris]PNS09415.1 hypothetical protein Lysil_1044 [Lysobacter silvestris]